MFVELDGGDDDHDCAVISNGTLVDCLDRCDDVIKCPIGEESPAPKAVRCDDADAGSDDLLCCCGQCERRTRVKWRQGPIGARDKVSKKGRKRGKKHGKGGVATAAKRGRGKKKQGKKGGQNRMKKNKKGKGKKAAARGNKAKKHKKGHKRDGIAPRKDSQGANKKGN